jgi:hypothetical protein
LCSLTEKNCTNNEKKEKESEDSKQEKENDRFCYSIQDKNSCKLAIEVLSTIKMFVSRLLYIRSHFSFRYEDLFDDTEDIKCSKNDGENTRSENNNADENNRQFSVRSLLLLVLRNTSSFSTSSSSSSISSSSILKEIIKILSGQILFLLVTDSMNNFMNPIQDEHKTKNNFSDYNRLASLSLPLSIQPYNSTKYGIDHPNENLSQESLTATIPVFLSNFIMLPQPSVRKEESDYCCADLNFSQLSSYDYKVNNVGTFLPVILGVKTDINIENARQKGPCWPRPKGWRRDVLPSKSLFISLFRGFALKLESQSRSLLILPLLLNYCYSFCYYYY